MHIYIMLGTLLYRGGSMKQLDLVENAANFVENCLKKLDLAVRAGFTGFVRNFRPMQKGHFTGIEMPHSYSPTE